MCWTKFQAKFDGECWHVYASATMRSLRQLHLIQVDAILEAMFLRDSSEIFFTSIQFRLIQSCY